MKNFRIISILAALASLSTDVQAQSSFNPTIAAQGFNVFTRSAVEFSAGDTHGPVATGGDVILSGNTIVSMNYHGYYPNGNGNTANYGLVIGGRIWYNSGNQTQLNRGQLRLGSSTGTNVYNVNANGTNSQVQYSAGAQNANPNIQSNSTMPLNSTISSNGLNFPTAFNAFATYSSVIKNYPTTHSTSTAINFLSVPPLTGGGSQTITLAQGKVNYLNLTGAQFAAMHSSGITYNFSRTLDSSTVVVFNITASGTYNWSAAAFGGISDNSLGDGQFILYNFPSATRINITGGRSTIGSILAPGAAVYKTGGNNAAGTIIADTFSMQYGEVHYAPFAGWLPGTGTALPLESIAINGAVQNRDVRIDWNAPGISGNAVVNVERSLDARTFEARAGLDAAERGIWSETVAAGLTRAYYRIRVAEPGRAPQYSGIWRADLSGNGSQITIAPVPFADHLTIRGALEAFSWELFDIRGVRILNGRCNGDCRITELGTLSTGTYVLKTSSESGETTQRVVRH